MVKSAVYGYADFVGAIAPKLSWYVARSCGLVASLVLTLSVAFGLLLSARILNRQTAPGWLLDVHRYLGGLGVVFTGMHIGGLVGDNWLRFGWRETLLPMASQWRPGAVAWGIAAFYLLLAIELTSFLKARLPRKLWRSVHYASFPLFVASVVHALKAGHDVHNRVFQASLVATLSVISMLTILRIVATRTVTSRTAQRTPAAKSTPALVRESA